LEFRKSEKADISYIMDIIKHATSYFKEKGIPQWQNGYPNIETISRDVENSNSYVLVKEGKIAGTAVISFDGEKTYDSIYDGQWLSDKPYAVIHRIAVDSSLKGQGLASIIIAEADKLCLQYNVHSLKVDTHEKNMSMQSLLKKNGFKRCGIIYLEDKSRRVAFEKVL
jgi:GNAT superfamily N-acetyltransferase